MGPPRPLSAPLLDLGDLASPTCLTTTSTCSTNRCSTMPPELLVRSLNQPQKGQNSHANWPMVQLRNIPFWEPIKLVSQTNFPNYNQSCRTIGRWANFENLASGAYDDPVADAPSGTGSAVFGACR